MHFLLVKKGEWSSEINGSEDSLYLSVFTPVLNSNSDLPGFSLLMVDIYKKVVETGMAIT